MSDTPRTEQLRIQFRIEQIGTGGLLEEYETLERELNEAHAALLDIPIGNEHETYSLAKRCEIAIQHKQYAWRQMDKARAIKEKGKL